MNWQRWDESCNGGSMGGDAAWSGVALQADRTSAFLLPHTLHLSLWVNLLEFRLCSMHWDYKRSLTPDSCPQREGDTDSLMGDPSKRSADFSDAEDPAKVPTSPATRAALWAPGSLHAQLCSPAGFMASAESLQLTSLGPLLCTPASSCPRCRAI